MFRRDVIYFRKIAFEAEIFEVKAGPACVDGG
jgi:hypothetical protein